MSRFITSAAFALAVALGAAPAVHAQKAEAKAPDFDALVASGGELFRQGKFAEARVKWQKAFELNPDPTLLFNIGSTYRREGDLQQALHYYQRYLDEAPPDAQYRAVAEEAVLNVKVQIKAKKRAAKPPPPPPPPPSGKGGTYLRWSGIGLGVLGLASLSFGIFQGLEAQDLNNKFEELPDGTEWTPELQDDFDRGESLETQAVAFSIAGGVAITVGALLYVGGVVAEPDATERPVSVAPFLTDDRAGLAVAGSF